MTPDEAFIQAIREQPDDDAPRLIYADWLEEHGQLDRAEFIRACCEAARLPRSDPRRMPLWRRARQLLECHWEEWAGPLRRAVGLRWDRLGNQWLKPGFHGEALNYFQRGFVEQLCAEAFTVIARPNAFAALAPLRHLGLWDAGSRMSALAATPYLAQVETLTFQDYFQSPVTDAGLHALAESPHLGRLTALGLSRNNITDDGLSALAAAPWLCGLSVLILGSNGLTGRGLRPLLEAPHPPRLTSLFLSDNALGDRAIEALARSPLLQEVTSLALSDNGLTDRAVNALITSPYLSKLTTLQLNRNNISPRAQTRLRLSPLGSQLATLHLDT
jgi:uncharacterized protein (TIGR02996 family)